MTDYCERSNHWRGKGKQQREAAWKMGAHACEKEGGVWIEAEVADKSGMLPFAGTHAAHRRGEALPALSLHCREPLSLQHLACAGVPVGGRRNSTEDWVEECRQLTHLRAHCGLGCGRCGRRRRSGSWRRRTGFVSKECVRLVCVRGKPSDRVDEV